MVINLYHAASMSSIFESFANKGLNMKTAFKLNKLMKETIEHLKFYQTKVEELFKEFGEYNEDGTPVLIDGRQKIKEDSLTIFGEKVQELNNIEVEYSDKLKFNIDEFNDVVILMNDMQLLAPFIEDEE